MRRRSTDIDEDCSVKQRGKQHKGTESDGESQQQQNDQFCFKCKAEGKLFCCDNCFRTYHGQSSCLDQTPSDNVWKCPCCSKRQICPICDVIVPKENDYLICTICMRLAHTKCSELPEIILQQRLDWQFFGGHFFICQICIYDSQIKKIQRSQKIGKNIFSLIIPNHVSNIHKTWIAQDKLTELLTKYRRRRQVRMVEEAKPEIQRILMVKKPIIYKDVSIYDQIKMLSDSNRVIQYGHPSNFKFMIKWTNEDYESCTWEDEYIAKTNPIQFARFIRLKQFEIGYLIQKKLSLKQFRVLQNNFESQPTFLGKKKAQYKLIKLTQQIINLHSKQKNILLQRTQGEMQRQAVIGFMNYLFGQVLIEEPILILTRQRDIKSWYQQLKSWADYLNIVVFNGQRDNRNVIKSKQFFYKNACVAKFNVLISTLEIYTKQHAIFNNKQIKVKWFKVILDDQNRYQLIKRGIVTHLGIYSKIIFFKQQIKKQHVKLFIQLNQKRNSKLTRNSTQSFQTQIYKTISECIPKINKTDNINKLTPPILINIKKSTMTIMDESQFKTQNMINDEDNNNSVVSKKSDSKHIGIQKGSQVSISQNLIRKQSQKQIIKQIIKQPIKQVQIQKQKLLIINQSKMIIQQQKIAQTNQINQNDKILLNNPQNISGNKQNNIQVPDQKQKIDKMYKINSLIFEDQIKRIAFLRFILLFGIDFRNKNQLFDRIIKFQSKIFNNTDQQKQNLFNYLKLFIAVLLNPDLDKSAHSTFCFNINPKGVHRRILDISRLLNLYKKIQSLQTRSIYYQLQLDKTYNYNWTIQQDLTLIKLTLQYGIGSWNQIVNSREWKSPYSQQTGIDGLIKKFTISPVSNRQKQQYCIIQISSRIFTITQKIMQANIE